ncbi:hypothetical protein GJV82_18120 [Cellulosimicrobium sp. BIT-GX5]|uniref:Uncharacterized protein n=1 Tax=Cellulosimicrobium composti TaxID=2672572 RepID=A0A6N7ZN38_9MICO|nr:hypothetical protein [Cellulosimicrobium composti]MTG90836.1 hypothetical protein [Cellulosimicrobium composti]
MTESPDLEAAATRAVAQARLLAHRATLEAEVAVSQAAALLLRSGMSQRTVAQLTGLSKSDVARRAKTPPPLGVASSQGSDTRVRDFAHEWIWGDKTTADAVVAELLRDE